MNKIRVSQQQIARDLGVSQSLVSMVLNGRQKGVSEDAYQRIWDYARQSGYRPKGIAPELLTLPGNIKSVGFMLRAGAKLYSQSPFFGHVQHGIHDYLAEQGIALHFMGSESNFDVRQLKHLQNPDAFQGLLILGEVSMPFLRSVLDQNSKVILVSAQYTGLCDSVLANEEQAANLLVQHLVELGHTKFAWVGGNRGMQRANGRLRTIQSALQRQNLTLDPKFCIEADSGERQHGRQVAELLLNAAERGQLPTAWICFNGIMARGVISCLNSKGFNVPGDISVAAFDATRACEDEHPTLTAADTSPELLGRVAAELLLKIENLDQHRFTDTVLPAAFTARESTGKAPKTKG